MFKQALQNIENMKRKKNMPLGNRLHKTALTKAIQEGIESGVAMNFDPKKHLQSLKAGRLNGNYVEETQNS